MKLRFFDTPTGQRLTSLAASKTQSAALDDQFKLLRAGLVARGVRDSALLSDLDDAWQRALRWAMVTPAIATTLPAGASSIDPTTIGGAERGGDDTATQDGRRASRSAASIAKGLAAVNARNRAFNGGDR
jgi:hypothetical protein